MGKYDRGLDWEKMEEAQAPDYIPPKEELAGLPSVVQEQYEARAIPTVTTQNQAFTDFISDNQEAYTQITQPPSNERSHDQYMMDTQNELEAEQEAEITRPPDESSFPVLAEQAEPGVFDPRSWAPELVDYLFGDKLSFSDVPIGEGYEAQVEFEDALVDQWVSDVLDVAKYTGGLTGAVAGIVGDFRNTTGSWSDYFGGTGDLTTALASSAGTIQRAEDILLPPPEYATDAVDKIIYRQDGEPWSPNPQPQDRTWNEFLYHTSRLDLEGLGYDENTDQVFRTHGSREGEVIDTTDQEVMKEFAKSAMLFKAHEADLPKIRLDDNNNPMNGVHVSEPYSVGTDLGFQGSTEEVVIEARAEGELIAVGSIQQHHPNDPPTIHSLGSNPTEGGLAVGIGIMRIAKTIESERFLGRAISSADIEQISSISPDAARMIHKYFTQLAQKAGKPTLGEWKGGTWTPK